MNGVRGDENSQTYKGIPACISTVILLLSVYNEIPCLTCHGVFVFVKMWHQQPILTTP